MADGPTDVACYHAQQCAEKLLKALLALAEKPIPRTHNLEELQAEHLRDLVAPILQPIPD